MTWAPIVPVRGAPRPRLELVEQGPVARMVVRCSPARPGAPADAGEVHYVAPEPRQVVVCGIRMTVPY